MKRIFFDMDGTLARFYEKANWMEVWRNPGFFLSLRPYESVIEAIKMLRERDDVTVYILSAAANETIKSEKREWLSKQFPGSAPLSCFFTELGENKAEHIVSFFHHITDDDILVDDYSANLVAWEEAGGKSVKLLNEVNGLGWNGIHFAGPAIDYSDNACALYKSMCDVFDIPLNAKRATLTVMVGLPASGKSTAAKALCSIDPNLHLISTDGIRKELYGTEEEQGDPAKVFNIAHKRVREELRKGNSVVFDATNVSERNRKSVLEQIPEDSNVLVRFWLMDTPLEECLRRNSARERVVPEEVIQRMASRFKKPSTREWRGPCIVTRCSV